MMTSHTMAVHITVDDQSHPAAVSELLSELSSRFKEVTRAEFMLGGQRWGGAEVPAHRGEAASAPLLTSITRRPS